MTNKGNLSAIGAYVSWGLFPLYWKQLEQVPSLEILAHRALWLLVCMVLFCFYKRQWKHLITALRDRRTLIGLLISSAILAINWGSYIWMVNTGYILQASLGAFISPLVSVALGMFVLKEGLKGLQRYALMIAVCGVIYLTISYQQVPWGALLLAFSTSGYALVKRHSKLSVQNGLALEASILVIPAILYLNSLQTSGSITFGTTDLKTTLMLAGAGVVTAIPLLLFAYGAKTLPFASLGMYQYVSPTLSFLIGVFIYREGFGGEQLVGFAIIWLAVILYVYETHRCNQCCPPIPTLLTPNVEGLV